ncbi:MAG TPA: hypothetical protein VFF65_02440 [Phycisphaerales bacterium]|nr:hypothetical protein [Phycisphaerales bacterium]
MILALIDETSVYNVSYLMGRIIGFLIILIVVLWLVKKIFGRR